MSKKKILDELRDFVEQEQLANQEKLFEVWEKPLRKKLQSGESQSISRITILDNDHLRLTLGDGESRFREGDMICLHLGDVTESTFVRQGTIETENDCEWIVRVPKPDLDAIKAISEICYADPDGMDLKPFFDKALDEIAESRIGINIVLPLLSGELDTDHIFEDNYDAAADYAEEQDLNENQIDAVGKGVASEFVACIQGPPGTGKTKVISLIAKLLVDEGQRVLLTSHTHMAINNALNKINEEDVPTIKVGTSSSVKGLDHNIPLFEHGADWEERPDNGYVIGATPFATCSRRLENFEFDTVIFDEASQITVPLAIMAMRKAKRYVFVGDHKQLPPVVLSKSVLDGEAYSVFSRLIVSNEKTSVMLNQTYRMNQFLSKWPSEQYYAGRLVSSGNNQSRTFTLDKASSRYVDVLSSEHSFVYIKSPGLNARTSSHKEAELVSDIIATAIKSGLAAEQVGVVTPYRNHGKTVRIALAKRIGKSQAKKIVTDTVERMQGQEREMIIISLCSTDVQFIQAVASFFFQDERLNVAITRPMTKLILIGPELPDSFSVDSRDEAIIKNIESYRSLVSFAYRSFIEGGQNGNCN